MSNENVKIKIHESNKTSPAGRGIDSSDIAFIPGFSRLGSAPQNTPVLCTSVEEFEDVFGAQPVHLTSDDVLSNTYPNLGFVAGEPDRSYVFAKELLTSGMPVVYTNVVNTDNVVEVEEINYNTAIDKTITQFTVVTTNPENVTVETSAAIKGSATMYFTCQIPDDNSNEPTDYVFEPVVGISDCNLAVAGVLLSTDNSTTSKKWTHTLPANPKKTYIYIQVLLKGNCPSGTKFSLSFFRRKFNSSRITDFYNTIDNSLDLLKDRGEYSVKYVTSGGYPSIYYERITDLATSKDTDTRKSDLATKLIACAKTRGDAVALIDYEQSTDKPVYGQDSVYNEIEATALSDGEYATAMYPWAQYNCSTITEGSTLLTLPASYAYLRCVASAIKTSPNWLAMAGVSRGIVRGVDRLMTKGVLTNTLAEECQPKYGETNHSVSINCITNIRPYGLVLWGNRTLKPVDGAGTDALNFLNTRNMLSDIKKVLYSTAKSLMFEQNTELLWNRFKGNVSPLLDQLKSGGAISNYKIIKSTKTYSGAPLSKGELGAVVRVYPIHAIEFFDLTVEIRDDDVTVS